MDNGEEIAMAIGEFACDGDRFVVFSVRKTGEL